MEEWDQKEEPDLCTRAVQELVGQWSLGGKSGDLTQSDQEDDTEGQIGMVSNAKSMGDPMSGRSRGTLGRASDGRSSQTMGIGIDTITMV